MLDSIPAWVTALVIIGITVVIVLLVILALAPRIGKSLAQGFASVIGAILLRVIDGEIETKRATLDVLKSTEKEAFAMVETLKAFELDEKLPPKLLQLVTVLRIGQLKHRYEAAVLALQSTQDALLKARRYFAAHPTDYYSNGAKADVQALEAQLSDQEKKLAELEPLLEKYGVDFEKAGRRLAIVE